MAFREDVPLVFADREDGGRRLAAELRRRTWVDPLVLGLARGGVPVAAVVARRLGADFDVAVARKIGAPGRREYGVGAVTPDGPAIYDEAILRSLRLTSARMARAEARERAEARRRLARYRDGRAPAGVADRDVILVDDGLATGVTATAALRDVRAGNPRTVVFAAPVGAPGAAARLLHEADDVVCVTEPAGFRAVGQWYADFRQTSDEDVLALLSGDRRESTEDGR
ncbi:phosphoribosyltransferase [Amycolatopsis nalaikhensis]|uniref:Phosphoribosyltransferase family protein n=1 Tax=Amycolatopsis nalaikhensis TaxID=715472 RepID=A0ABY8XIM6_9PSEU|nr:phosphoribosyltransferase family protein [Amycolatopsis sp. 2-2]WIV55491.1 phosphoribosyltransferase family protein [Amycolatopsis sp. 2-2]